MLEQGVALGDGYSRRFDYLRLSITDMCNLRCIYCRPWEEIGKKTHQELLSYEEIIRLASLLGELGIKRIRITGGEPLIKRDVIHLIEELAKIKSIEELSLTTNATKLTQFAWLLKIAGIDRINISLDSLDKNRYNQITGGGNLNDVLDGIEEALKARLVPLKINVVVMSEINDDEIEKFARLTLDKDIQVRFIEFMPIGTQMDLWSRRYLPGHVIKERITSYFSLIPTNDVIGNGPADYYQIEGAMGTLGFISPISNHFCSRCNRLRLTSDGHLRLCLGNEMEFDLKGAMRNRASDEELKRIIVQAVKQKPKGHQFYKEKINGRQMVAMGG